MRIIIPDALATDTKTHTIAVAQSPEKINIAVSNAINKAKTTLVFNILDETDTEVFTPIPVKRFRMLRNLHESELSAVASYLFEMSKSGFKEPSVFKFGFTDITLTSCIIVAAATEEAVVVVIMDIVFYK